MDTFQFPYKATSVKVDKVFVDDLLISKKVPTNLRKKYGLKWCRLSSLNLNRLHQFARLNTITEEFFIKSNGTIAHYLIPAHKRDKIVSNGAIIVTSEKLNDLIAVDKQFEKKVNKCIDWYKFQLIKKIPNSRNNKSIEGTFDKYISNRFEVSRYSKCRLSISEKKILSDSEGKKYLSVIVRTKNKLTYSNKIFHVNNCKHAPEVTEWAKNNLKGAI